MAIQLPIRVYCAGPLFNDPELDEMQRIADAFLHPPNRFTTFLPQRDGLELLPNPSRARDPAAERTPKEKGLAPHFRALGLSPNEVNHRIHQAIFAFDVFQLVTSDAVVVNLNGRVPDEGTVVEAALAWQTGKGLVMYKKDDRSPFDGFDNPMLRGLGRFRCVDSIAKLPDQVSALTADVEYVRKTTAAIAPLLPKRVSECLRIGEKIADSRADHNGPDGYCTDGRALAESILAILSSSPWGTG